MIDPNALAMMDINRGYQSPDPERQDTITEFIFSNEPLINKFIAGLLGRLYDPDKCAYVNLSETQKPVRMMNDCGITKWAGYLSTLTDRSILHSNLKKEEVCELTLQEMVYIFCDLFQNSENYDLDIKNFDFFIGQMILIVFITLKRPQDAGERRAINTRGKVFEHKIVKSSDDSRGGSGITSETPSFFKGVKRR